MDEFGTVLNCMDGRTQRKVTDYLLASFTVRNLDTITTAGMVRHIEADTDQTPWLLANLSISIDNHSSRKVAVVAHHDCAGNPVPDSTQKEQLGRAVTRLNLRHPGLEVIGLWIDKSSIVFRVAGS